MNMPLTLAFLFSVGSIAGWVLELLFRNTVHKSDKWINPGFCTGPYVPLYGFGLCALFLLALLENIKIVTDPFWNKALLFALMAISMTLIEYLAGLFCLKVLKVRLWDYSDQWGNLQGIVCPLFSFFWAVLGAMYYFLIHPHILQALQWLSNNLAFSFFIGLFFGVFAIDVAHSAQLIARLRQFAAENNVVVKYEGIKQHIRDSRKKNSFFRPFHSEQGLNSHLREMYLSLENRQKK